MWLSLSLIILASIFIWVFGRKPSNYPPGPWGLPFIGWPFTSIGEFNQKLLKWREEKIDMIGWRIGSNYVVNILDYDLFKEAFQHPSIAFRPEANSFTNFKFPKNLGIINSSGAQWTHSRRFTLRHLRDFGMGKEKLLLDAHFEADNFVDDLKKRVGKPSSVPQSLLISILNNVWQMVGNTRYEYDDKDITDFVNLTSALRIYGSRLMILDLFPWLENVLPTVLSKMIFKSETVDELNEKVLEYFKKCIKQHMKDLNKEVVQDYIDAYLVETEKRKDDPDSLMSIEDLLVCLVDLFVGATETTAHTIHWSILYLAKFQNVQEKLQEEVDRVLPSGSRFLLKDKTNLPYTEAFIHEVFRMSSVALSPVRAAVEDTKIGPYVIPKGAWVLGRIFIIHHDPKYWDSPYEFRPERFLNSDGKFVIPTKGFAPFGSGRRLCIGEAIARMHLFVYITKLAQNFHFECPSGENITLEDVGSPFLRIPKGSPELLIKPRQKH